MIKDNPFTLKGIDRWNIHVHSWIPEKPVALMIMVHGMTDHGGRFGNFANFMTSMNIGVFAPDQRGHGETVAKSGKPGYFGKGITWETLVSDLFCLRCHVDTQLPGLPVFLLGHSMGSLVSRYFASKYGEQISGLILSGTFNNPRFLMHIGIGLTKFYGFLFGRDYHSRFVQSLSLGPFNKPFKPNRTGYDWISSDEKAVDEYIADPFAGHEFAVGSWCEVFKLYLALNRNEKKCFTPGGFPVFLIYGLEDPVGKMGKDPRKLNELFKKKGMTKVKINGYQKARHEILNDHNKEEVYMDVYNWLKGQLEP